MKITDVTTYIVGNPWKNWAFTRVDTDEGVHGIAEAILNGFAKTVESAIHELKRFVIGEDPSDVEKHTLKLFREVYSDGGQIHGAALSGIEYTCWDIMGRMTKQPVYKQIGGRCHNPAARRAQVIGLHPVGRLGTAGEVGALCAFLCIPLAGYISGTTILIDGGRSAIMQDA